MTPTINSTETISQGWTPQPDGRGTIDIIWNCLTTIFLCCWTALCLNLPPADWSLWRRIRQKTFMSCLGIIGPEFVFQLALGQWLSARRSVVEFKESGYPQWTISHAFLADMGGFVLKPPDWVPFPLDAKQVHYLVKEGYIDFQQVWLDKAAITDRNKGDGMVRFITVCQILWFFFNCFGRVIQHLAMTTLELTTIGFIVSSIGTYILWAHKPKDVGNAIILVPNTTLSNILIKAGDSGQEPYKFTPLDFVGRDKSSWILYWTYWMNILRKLKIVFATKKRPIDKIPDDYFRKLSPLSLVVLFLSQTTYAAVHLSGWNFHFPTPIERMLWHIATLVTIVSIVSYWIVDLFTWQMLPRLKNYLKRRDPQDEKTDVEDMGSFRVSSKSTSKVRRAADRLRNNSPGHDPALSIPLKAIMPITMIGACYCFARAYILLADFVALRSLPSSAYETVNWLGLLPHFQ